VNVQKDITKVNLFKLPVCRVCQELMLHRMAQSRAFIAVKANINQNPMLRNAFKCKKGIINRDPQPKSNAQRVKRVVVVVPLVRVVKSGGFKIYRAIPRVVNAPLDLVTQPKVLRRAMVFLPVHTAGMVTFVNVKRVIIVKEKQQIKPRADLDRTPPKKVPFHALNVHPVHTPPHTDLLPVIIVELMNINQHPMPRTA